MSTSASTTQAPRTVKKKVKKVVAKQEAVTPAPEENASIENTREPEPTEPAPETPQDTVVTPPVDQPEVVEAPVSDSSTGGTNTALVADTQRYDELLDALFKNFELRRKLDKEAVKDLKDLKKLHNRIIREVKKKKKKPVNADRKPSGFHKEGSISDELCDFLSLPHGTRIPRTAVTIQLIKYIKDNNLQHPEKGRLVVLDDALRKLLNNPQEDVSYFNIQKFLGHHFPESKKNKARLEMNEAVASSSEQTQQALAL